MIANLKWFVSSRAPTLLSGHSSACFVPVFPGSAYYIRNGYPQPSFRRTVNVVSDPAWMANVRWKHAVHLSAGLTALVSRMEAVAAAATERNPWSASLTTTCNDLCTDHKDNTVHNSYGNRSVQVSCQHNRSQKITPRYYPNKHAK